MNQGGEVEIVLVDIDCLPRKLNPLIPCGEMSFNVQFDPKPWPSGQFLLGGEPMAAQHDETGEWDVTYPVIWIPAAPTDAWTFGGEVYEGPFVQEATE